jgi:hypothetical protein
MDNHLIRITTVDPESRFDGTINADLNIAPGSEIALKSLYVEKESDMISIRNGQNTITYTFRETLGGADKVVQGTLRTAEYDTNNFQELLDNIQGVLNTNILYEDPSAALRDPYLLGMEFQAKVNEELKIQIEMGKANIGPQIDLWEEGAQPDVVNDEETGAAPDGVTSDVWYVDDVITNGKPRVMKIDERIPNGVGYMDAMLWSVAHDATLPANRNSFALCFTDIDISIVTPDEIAENLSTYNNYGVGIATTATGFEIISTVDASETSLATMPGFPTEGQSGNQRVRLLREGRKIYAVYQDATGSENATGTLIATLGSDNQHLYPFVVFFTDESNIKIGQLQCSISHFSRELTTPALTLEEPIASTADRPFPSKYTPPKGWALQSSGWIDIPFYDSTNNKLEFESKTLAKFLGYNFKSHPRNGFVRNLNFAAPAAVKFGPRIAVDELIVLAENMDLNSYDTFIRQRKNILDVVGVDTSNDGKVIYNADFPNFISLSNNESRIMRNFKFRIVEKDYSTMQLDGQAAIVVLIRSPKQ